MRTATIKRKTKETDIEVTVRDREVTLDGTVDSRMAKRRAEDCADAVSGVEHVQNNLRVSRAADTARSAETSSPGIRASTSP